MMFKAKYILRFLTIIFLIFFANFNQTFAQNKSKEKADKKFTAGDYSEALKYYFKAEKLAEPTYEIYYIYMRLGDCYRLTKVPKQATNYYKKALNGSENLAEITFNYAESYKMLEKYKKAIELYNKYIELNPRDTLADSRIRECEQLKKSKKTNVPIVDENLDKIKSIKNEISNVKTELKSALNDSIKLDSLKKSIANAGTKLINEQTNINKTQTPKAAVVRANPLFSQNKLIEKAYKKFLAGEYYSAANMFLKSVKKVKSKSERYEIYSIVGDCYRLMRAPKQAAIYYKKSLKGKKNIAENTFNYAESLKMLSKYDLAIEQYKKYIELSPDELPGIQGIKSCEMILDWEKNPTQYVIENLKPLNSKSDDFCPTLNARNDYKIVIFTSNRKETTGKKTNGITGVKNNDLFEAKLDRKGKWIEPEKFDTLINSIYEDGAAVLNEKANEIYFTHCKSENGKKIGCQIYKSTKNEGYWDKAAILPIVGDSISIGHPSLSDDELSLYFASRELGGEGGSDIWRVTRKSKTEEWGKPENLGTEINTTFDELYPFIRKDSVLYFASDRQPSMGGLDIFKAKQDTLGNFTVENMQSPINSSADDFGIVFKGTTEEGMFSSARKDGVGGVDIYSFIVPPLVFTLQGTVKDQESNKLLSGAVVKLIGSDGRIFKDTTDVEKGIFAFELKPKTEYIYIASFNGYFNYKGKISTDSLNRSQVIDVNVLMASVAKTIELPNIEYDFGSYQLRETSKTALLKLVETLNDNPSITIEILSHSDMVGADSTNLALSQKRAQSVVDFLISNNIDSERLKAKGYGETMPRKVTAEISKIHSFLKEGTILNSTFTDSLSDENQKQICNQLNRRTEFKVLSTNFSSSKLK